MKIVGLYKVSNNFQNILVINIVLQNLSIMQINILTASSGHFAKYWVRGGGGGGGEQVGGNPSSLIYRLIYSLPMLSWLKRYCYSFVTQLFMQLSYTEGIRIYWGNVFKLKGHFCPHEKWQGGRYPPPPLNPHPSPVE
jgi:hypothetical protein